MRKSIFSLSLVLGFMLVGFGQAALAGGRTVERTGPEGNSRTTERTWEDGDQTVERTGPEGNSRTTERTVDDDTLNTTRTGPEGNSRTVERTWYDD